MSFTTTCWLLSASFWLLTLVTPWCVLPAVAWSIAAACGAGGSDDE